MTLFAYNPCAQKLLLLTSYFKPYLVEAMEAVGGGLIGGLPKPPRSTEVDLWMLIEEPPDDRSADEHRFGSGGRFEAGLLDDDVVLRKGLL